MTKRDGIVVAVLGVVLALGAFWWFALKPLRGELSTLEGQVATERQALDAARQQVGAARAARARYVEDYASIARLGKAVPADDDLPALVVQLQNAAEGAKVDFQSVRLASAGVAASGPASAPAPVATAAAANGTTPPATGTTPPAAGGTAPAAPGPGTPAAPAPATQAATAALPPGATVGSAGLATMPFTFVFEGSFLKMQQFLDRVQGFIAPRDGRLEVSGRLLTIDGVGISAGAGGFPTVKASITATAYVLPPEQGLTAGATPQAPAAPAAAPAAPGTATASSPSPSTPVAAAGATP